MEKSTEKMYNTIKFVPPAFVPLLFMRDARDGSDMVLIFPYAFGMIHGGGDERWICDLCDIL